MTPEQVALMQGIGSLIKDCSGPQDLTGDVFYPPQTALPPCTRGARPKIAVNGGSYGDTKKNVSQSRRIRLWEAGNGCNEAHGKAYNDR
jgi:hypothetical protein